jgi:NTE family protein
MQSGSFACDIIVTSDAGNGLTREKSLRNSLQVAMRTMNVFMTRIKNVQMITDVYQNHEPGNKEIAYLSLGWNVENCIPGFVRNLKSKTIPDSLIAWHQLLPDWVADPDKYSTEICEHLAYRIQYDWIVKPSPEELAAARSVGTNLTPLKRTDILALIKQAEALTEVQIKLYCPSL